MSNFVHCRGCGHQIHETAPMCPKCGAPQLQTANSQAVATASAPVPDAYTGVRWFRRRWFTVLCVLTIAPIAAVTALTGPLYFQHKGQVGVLPKDAKFMVYLASVAWLYQVFANVRGADALFLVVSLVGMALVLGLKNWGKKK